MVDAVSHTSSQVRFPAEWNFLTVLPCKCIRFQHIPRGNRSMLRQASRPSHIFSTRIFASVSIDSLLQADIQTAITNSSARNWVFDECLCGYSINRQLLRLFDTRRQPMASKHLFLMTSKKRCAKNRQTTMDFNISPSTAFLCYRKPTSKI